MPELSIQPQNLLAVFNSLPGAYLLLSAKLTIEAASDAYLEATLTQREDLIGRYVFDVFPDNPQTPEAQSVKNLKASLEQVLATGKPHEMAPQHYDVADPANPGQFVERHWLPLNTPVLDEQGCVQHIIHTAVNITDTIQADRLLQESKDREQTARAEAAEQLLARRLLEHREARLLQTNQELTEVNKALEAANSTVQDTQATIHLLQAMFKQAPVGIGLFQGTDHLIISANEKICAMWGYTPEQVLNKPLLEAVPELKGQGFTEILTKVSRTRVPYVGKEAPAQLLQNGRLELHYFDFVFQPLYDQEGSLLGILDIAMDVTAQVLAHQRVQALNEDLEARVVERTQAAQEARLEAERARNRLEHLFMQAPAAICILNGPDLVYELVNPAYQQLFPDRVLLGKPILTALPEISDNAVYRTFREVYRTGKTHEEQELLIPLARPQDGVLENRYFNFIQQARYNALGQIDGVLVFAFEVTMQVTARQASEASAHQLRLITNALPVLIGYLDQEEKYRFANQAYRAWFNQDPAELLGRPVREVVGEKAYSAAQGYIARALTGERLDFEATMPYRENFTKHIRTSYIPDVQNGEVVGFFTLVSDITQQVEARQTVEASEKQAKAMAAELASANEELKKANQQLTHINTDLDNFIYTASHDLKTPILNIEGLMDALLEQLTPDNLHSVGVQHTSDLILDSVQRFKRTINHLTEITKLQKENTAESLPIDIAALVADVQLDLALAIQETQAQIEVDVAQCATIRFSKKNLRSIIYNLLSNAIKYHSWERPPLVRVSCQATQEYQVLLVQDNGLGINPAQHHKLFAMFSRLHNHVEGSGVGLYMVKKIIENAGGKIEVQSKVGEGSTFSVYFKRN